MHPYVAAFKRQVARRFASIQQERAAVRGWRLMKNGDSKGALEALREAERWQKKAK